MTTRLPGPARPGTLTPPVLSAVLRSRGLLDEGNTVTAVRRGPTGGSGLVADIERISLEYAWPAAVAPRSLIVKSAAPDGADRRALARAETRFYATGTAAAAGLRAPAALLCEIDGATGDCLLLLEDLGDDGFVRQIDGCTPDAAARALGEVARLHAHGRAAAPAATSGWIPAPAAADVTVFCRRWLTAYTGDWPGLLGSAPRVLVENLDELAARLAGPPGTVVHGDLHSQNVHQGRGGAVTLIDFQFVQRAVAVLDVARFLATSLTVEVRRRHESDLLRHHRDEVARHGAGGGRPAGSADQFRAALLWNLAVPLALHVREILTTGTTWPQSLPILRRCVAAVDDWDAPAVLGSRSR